MFAHVYYMFGSLDINPIENIGSSKICFEIIFSVVPRTSLLYRHKSNRGYIMEHHLQQVAINSRRNAA